MTGVPPAGPIGFVDVWAGDRQLARRDIIAGEMAARLAGSWPRFDFVLPEPTEPPRVPHLD